jgi:methylated-DNA-[protein]-cysteine S-methyltransferase
MGTTYYTIFDSPVGELMLVGRDDAVTAIEFAGGRRSGGPKPDWVRSDKPLREAIRQLKSYFAGKRTSFDLPLSPAGTEFQRQTWNALLEIPYGETRSYAQIAERIGRPKAVRAVGAANGSNPISIVVPCHRVIGSNGDLTGFGGGLDVKRKLLNLEGALPQPRLLD